MMTHEKRTPVNLEKISRLEAILAEMLGELLRRGFFGTARIELSVQDGTIQNIRRVVEQIEK